MRTTLDPNLQRMARKALIDGLVAFDREKGWRGPVQKIDIAGDWGAALDRHRGSRRPGSPGASASCSRRRSTKAVVGLRPARQADGSLVAEREAVEIPFEEVKWARSGRAAPKVVTDVLGAGDVIWVAPKDPAKPAGTWSLMQVPEVGGGLVAMDPHTGRVHAVVGGFSFATSQFDRALQAKRQPGSSFKPLVYTAALDNGYKPTSIVLDAPIEIDQGPGKEIWQPKNYDGTSSFGPSTLRLGIEKSRNQMTVRLAQDMGMPLIVEYAKRFGVYDDLLPVLAMSLGAGETTLLRMCAAYAALANGGKQVQPDPDRPHPGSLGPRHLAPRQARVQGLQGGEVAGPARAGARRRPQADHRPAHRLSDDLDDGGRGAARHRHRTSSKMLPNVPIAGKTGTTNDEKDAWFIGYTPDLVVGVFIGYDSPKHLGKGTTGGQVAAPVFANFLKMALADKKAVPFRIPPGIKLVRVSLRTGLRAQGGEGDSVHGGLQALRGARRRLFGDRLHRRERRLFHRRPDRLAARPERRPQRLLSRTERRLGQAKRRPDTVHASACVGHPRPPSRGRRNLRSTVCWRLQSQASPISTRTSRSFTPILHQEAAMRAEAEKLAEAIRQSLALLRRHL